MKNGGGYPESELPYDNASRIEPKRHSQWLLDSSDTEFFHQKKTAVEDSNGRPISVIPNPNHAWQNYSNFQTAQPFSGHFLDRSYGPDSSPRTIDFGARNFQSINAGNSERDHYRDDASIGLSMSHTSEDPGSYLNYGGHRKVKVNQVKDFDNSLSFSGFQEAPDRNPEPHRHNTISFGGYQVEQERNPPPPGRVPHGRVPHIQPDAKMMSMQMGNTISFSGFPVEQEMSNNYNMLMRQSSLEQSEVVKETEVHISSNSDLTAKSVPVSGVPAKTSKAKNESKESKKVAPNSFPSNVRSLLNTGMLDGVPVKYMSWQQEKELGGIIKGCGYRCGCNSCNYNKVLNAYEFEKHAGSKTKHPNNHIFFDNGKTIYSIVQELKTTTPNMLFDAIQNCTGSPINQKAFVSWRESYQAATRELERIYGKDLLNLSTESKD
ncbi:hypothetical protein ACHQM5_018230 [Ranunculus cassubicifolius]